MKKILSIALIAVTTVMASPVFSGRFGVKYTYTYETGTITAGNRNYLYLSDSSDLWNLELQTIDVEAGNDLLGDGGGYSGYATINVSEGLKTLNVELPVSLDVSIGKTGQYADFVYTDPNSKVGDYWDLGLTTKSNAPFAVSVGLNGWTATVAAGIETDKQAIGVDVTGTLFNGVMLEAAFSTEDEFKLQASALFDIGKIADLDVTAKVSGFGFFDFSDSANNKYIAAVNLGYKALSGSIEYRNIQVIGENGLWAKASFKVNDMITLGGGVNVSDLANFGDTLGFNANDSIELNGITTYIEASNKAITTYTQFTF